MNVLENLFLPAQIPERSDVSNDQRHAKLIFRADRAERQAPVFQRDPAAGSVVADLHELILQDLLLDVIAESDRGIPPAAVHVAISDLGADLIRERLQNGGVVDGKMRHGKIEILIGLKFQQRAGRA